jgi:uncharacterized protein YndB with AHSA1/START domain
MNAGVVTVHRTIKARPATVFSFFTDRDRWLSWQGVTAEIDARPGGVFRMNVRGDSWASGSFVAVEPYRRLVFTWGWEGADSPVPPGSSMVEITLEPDGEDGTRLTLIHTGLPLPAIDMHCDGWNHYLDRLTIRATGGDPGPQSARSALLKLSRDEREVENVAAPHVGLVGLRSSRLEAPLGLLGGELWCGGAGFLCGSPGSEQV